MKKDTELSELINKVKDSPKTLQKISPIKPSKDETQFSFWIEKKLLKDFKLIALKEDISLKDLITKCIEEYIKEK